MGKRAETATGVRIEMMALASIQGAPRNPKAHDIKTLLDSLERFGFVAPLVMNESTLRLVAGHGRLEALRARKKSGLPPPRRVTVGPDGDWLVPVVRGLDFASEQEAEAYLVADNRLSELGGWNDTDLALVLAELSTSGEEALRGLGYDKVDIATMITEQQLKDLKLPPVAVGQESKGTDPRDEKWWVWADCANEDEMNAVLARFGCGKGRQMDIGKLLAVPLPDVKGKG